MCAHSMLFMTAWLFLGSPLQVAPNQDKPPPPGRPIPLREVPPPEAPQQVPQPAPAPPRAAPEPLPVRLDVTVFELTVPAARLAELSAPALAAQAATPQALQQALAKLGEARLLYRVDQSVDLARPSNIEVVADVPYVSSINESKEGQSWNGISRLNVGLHLSVLGMPAKGDPRNSVELDFRLDLTALTASAVEVVPDLHAPVFRKSQQPFGGIVERGKPVVLLTVDAASDAANGMVYLTRVVVGEPGAAPPAGDQKK